MNIKKPNRSGMYRTFLLLVSILCMLGLSSVASSAVIDSFTTPQADLIDNTADGAFVFSSTGDGTDATILGGSRDSSTELLSGPTQAMLQVIDYSGGVASMSVGFLSTGRVLFQWDGPDNSIGLNTTGLQSVDLTLNGAMDAFSITT
ncbi:MAG: hypothetical protein KAI17_22225, partial [Thiotrichaceae bacterium]|nr:hypothetical protein [Thiotrichaceae bacterium]